MEKSYSDFAKELGVSKQKLNYYVNDENKEKIFIKKGNKKKKAKKKKKILRYFLIA